MQNNDTVSTLDYKFNRPPSPIQQAAPTQQNHHATVGALETIWKKYFANKHSEVLTDANNALFAGRAPDYLHICGLSLLAQGRKTEGIDFLKMSLILYPTNPSWFSNASIAGLNADAKEAALEFAINGLQHFKDDVVLNFVCGNALLSLDKLDECLSYYQKSLQLKPDMHDARLNYGNALRRLGRADEAVPLYTQVLNANPENTLAMINRAGALMELNENDEASMMLLRLMAIRNSPELSFMMALIRMSEGDFDNGYDLYRQRFDCAMAAGDKLKFRRPLISTMEEAKTSHLLVSHEQGFGDTLQYIRYLPLIKQHAKKVTLLMPKNLQRIIRSVDANVQMIEDRDEIGSYDFECPLLHIPYLLKTEVETIPASIPYLSVSDELIKQRKLPPSTKKRVGIVWAGQQRENPDLAAVDRRRSISYDKFEQILDVDGIEFVSLQLNDKLDQINTLGKKEKKPLLVLNKDYDFADTAAIIMQLDLVVTVDTAVVHLAAALGKPVWMLSRFDQCWRWLRDREDSPWYPGVMRIFQQRKRNDWIPVIDHVKEELQKWVQE